MRQDDDLGARATANRGADVAETGLADTRNLSIELVDFRIEPVAAELVTYPHTERSATRRVGAAIVVVRSELFQRIDRRSAAEGGRQSRDGQGLLSRDAEGNDENRDEHHEPSAAIDSSVERPLE